MCAVIMCAGCLCVSMDMPTQVQILSSMPVVIECGNNNDDWCLSWVCVSVEREWGRAPTNAVAG